MSKHPILSLKQANISFAKKILFENLDLHIFERDRVCLIGKNGVGKTTLLNAIANEFELEDNQRFQMPNIHLSYLRQNEKLPANLTILEFIARDLKIDDHKKYLIDIICERLKIDKNLLTTNLSGGQSRRVFLAKALIIEPDILLLDEPTNHLDIEVIEWLESYLQSFKGALVIISHDRKFLEKVTNKVFWIRASQIKINNFGYKNFDQWSQNIIDHEFRELENLEKKVALESQWLQTGVTARRKRNIGRLHFLSDLKTKLNEQRNIVHANKSKVILKAQEIDDDAPQVIMNINNLSYNLVNNNNCELKLINSFSYKIIRKERIGIIGKNGCGKSTLLKLMINEIKPTTGTIKLAKDLVFSYFDQSRSAIKPDKTIQEILCETGSDYIQLADGKMRHICGYLKDFAFDANDRYAIASTLSGGQQNRLLLAKSLANPSNFMILDEPTNDLDMDTLDILENYLEDYQGTLLIVSHDRDFLDNIATTIFAFEEDGVITANYGGYSDYLNSKKPPIKDNQKINNLKIINSSSSNIEPVVSKNFKEIKYSYKMQIEQEKILEKIKILNQKIANLSEELNCGETYNPNDFAQIANDIAQFQNQITKLENKWLEYEEIKEKNS